MKELMHKLEELMEIGGTKKDILFLAVSAIALVLNLTGNNLGLPFNICWIAIILCGVPIIMEAVIGMVTEFDITADVPVSQPLIDEVMPFFEQGATVIYIALDGILSALLLSWRYRSAVKPV